MKKNIILFYDELKLVRRQLLLVFIVCTLFFAVILSFITFYIAIGNDLYGYISYKYGSLSIDIENQGIENINTIKDWDAITQFLGTGFDGGSENDATFINGDIAVSTRFNYEDQLGEPQIGYGSICLYNEYFADYLDSMAIMTAGRLWNHQNNDLNNIYMSETLCELLDITVGDEITLQKNDVVINYVLSGIFNKTDSVYFDFLIDINSISSYIDYYYMTINISDLPLYNNYYSFLEDCHYNSLYKDHRIEIATDFIKLLETVFLCISLALLFGFLLFLFGIQKTLLNKRYNYICELQIMGMGKKDLVIIYGLLLEIFMILVLLASVFLSKVAFFQFAL